MINLQLRPGGFVAALPVDAGDDAGRSDGQVVALYTRTSCTRWSRATRPSSRSNTYPGRVIKGKVDSIIWAQGAGQLQASGTLPMTGVLTSRRRSASR